jgi:hypothetical protein
MTSTRTGAYTEVFRDQYGTAFTERLRAAAAAAVAGDFDHALVLAERFRDGAAHMHRSVVRDALAAGLDWWRLGALLSMHPQAAFDAYANLLAGSITPARQHPALAVVCTAGLAELHDIDLHYGIDLEDLSLLHSLRLDPTVRWLHAAAKTLGEDIWIAVRLPGMHDSDNPPDDRSDALPDGMAIFQWTTVVVESDELGSLRDALALAGSDTDQDE